MPADILSASLAERLRAHSGAIREIALLLPRDLPGDSMSLLRAVDTLRLVATRLELDDAESPREAKP